MFVLFDQAPYITTSIYMENGQWNITGTSIVENSYSPIEEDVSTYSSIDFCFYFQRKTTYHLLNVIVPLVMVGTPYSCTYVRWIY